MDRPIIFSGPMVEALLAGRKTQTRRILNPQPGGEGIYPDIRSAKKALRIVPGDCLWVREAWCWAARGSYDARDDGGEVWYRATDEGECEGPWKPSIHMSRACSRLTLTVTDVRVQRLQDISEEDAEAEGVRATEFWHDEHPPSICFSVLWNSINGSERWHANPWVAAYTFTVERRNIDAPALPMSEGR